MNYIDREKFVYKQRYIILISLFILSYLLYNRNLYYKKNKYIFILLILITGFYASIIFYTIFLGLLMAFILIKESIIGLFKNSNKNPNLNKISFPVKKN